MKPSNITEYNSYEMIERFIGIETTTRVSNMPLIHFARDYLNQFGIHSEIIPNPDGEKANLLARIGPAEGAGVVFSGHSDTVPVEDQDWTTDPFRLSRANDLLIGRGTVDMKGFLAICTALAPEFARADLKAPIYIAMSYDEEIGCLGVHSMIERLKALPTPPRYCIVGEPSHMDVVIAHKGANVFETTIRGREAHSSQANFGESSIAAAAEMIHFLYGIGQEMRERGDLTGVFEQDAFTSVNVGTIQGGTAMNIIARDTRFAWEYRHIPNTDADEIINRFHAHGEKVLARMRQRAPEATLETEVKARVDALRPERGTELETLAMACAEADRSYAVAFGTEAGIFQSAGIPTIVCGPGHIEQAHRPNEALEVDQVERCAAFLRRLVQTLV